ncbi:sigma-70 family RNA polymerase sigma factor [Mucilaginibacter robiniae]|uniref:Sigma-70 family RNA polymerase sigma factor n=1 Tax=Mucilaginibacter robiniae TaxID=2728022 RepID=A0A7L5ED23_9SPHI|nr:sigma-70 family RNA polymerase sigma factor [Mucilaginibacter robiniae]QJD98326.1 sigma-70 family RNA polymerase sigma factor [Mucilaginibacter robiniae]
MPEEKNSYLLKAIKDYGQSLLSFIRRRVKNDADAEDILQDVWYQLSAMVNASPVEQTGAWLYRVARNKITDKYRKHSESLLDDLFGNNDTDDEPDYSAILFTDAQTPETEYLRNLFWEELFAALDELPPEQKQVFIWQELDDMPFQEIAERTGVNVQTLVSRKRYAVLHLRKRLKQLYEELTKH